MSAWQKYVAGLRLLPIAVALAALQMGCNSDSVTADGSPTLGVEALSATSIAATVGGTSPVAPAIRVTGANTGNVQADVPVRFEFPGTATRSGFTKHVVTDKNGVATAGEWRFGAGPGLTELKVFVNDVYRLTFSAMLSPDVPYRLKAIVAQEQAGIQEQMVEGPAVTVEDRFRNPISSVEVTFIIIEGDGTLEVRRSVTDRDGKTAAGYWRLGGASGGNKALARLAGVDPILFRAEAFDAADYEWYELEAVIIGSQEYRPAGIVNARLGLTAFDKCLCLSQQGRFLDLYDARSASGRLVNANSAGTYALGGNTLTLPGWLAGRVHGERLVLLRRKGDLFDFEDELWTYKLVGGTEQ